MNYVGGRSVWFTFVHRQGRGKEERAGPTYY